MASPTTMNDTKDRLPTGAAAADHALWPARALATARRTTSPRFYACVVILLLAAVSMQSLAGILGTYFRKQAVPLKRSLDALDQSRLLPEYRPHARQPEPLNAELIENLGTEQYLQWNLADLRRSRQDPTALVQLFITYHTGQPDPVPHRPEECQAAAGKTLRDRSHIEVALSRTDGEQVTIPVSILEFELPPRQRRLLARPGRREPRQFVAYFFYANGCYTTSRTGVRTAVANLWDRYAYYSKIEVSFSDDSSRKLASRDETIEATRRLLRKLMPILWDDHYQDWEALKQGEAPVIREG